MKLRASTRAVRSVHSLIEPLEARVAPAGIITATFAGGILTLTGDGAANDIDIVGTGQDFITITGNGGTTIALNGAAAAATASFTGNIKTLNGNLGVGNDSVNLFVVTLGSLSLDGGDGNDSLIFTNTVATGPVKFVGGNNDDTFTGNSTLFKVGGPLTLDMGDGTNTTQFSAAGAEIGGAITIMGGTGVDSVQITSAGLLASKGLTAKLGDGDNNFTYTGNDARFLGPVSISHLNHAGTATTNFNASGTLTIAGGLTVSYGTGSSNTVVTAASDIGGALKVNSIGGADSLTLSATNGVATVKGGVNVDFGSGTNVVTLSGGSLVTPGVTFTGTGGTDVFSTSLASLRVGAITLNLGDGANVVSIVGTDVVMGGLLKVTTGTGDDTFTISVAEARLTKGVTYAAGDGVNTLNAAGTSLASGPLNVTYGAHAAGTSSVILSSSVTKIAGAVNITGTTGNETVAINSTSFTSGAVTAKLGDGANAFTVASAAFRAGAVAVTTGAGTDTMAINGNETVLAGLKAFLGDGANSLTATGGSLSVGGVLTFATGNGDDVMNLTHQSQKLKGISATVGDGLFTSTVTGGTVQIGGPVTLLAGSHIAGTSIMTIAAGGALFVGPVNATFGNGDNQFVVSATTGRMGAVKFVGGSGVDTFQVALNANGVTGIVNFNGGDGTNTAFVSVNSGKAGGVKYIGGSGTDVLVASVPLGTMGAITANFGTGGYLAQFAGTGQTIFTGAINVMAANQAGQTGTLVFNAATFKAAMTLKLGDGVDTVQALDIVAGAAFKLDTAGGADVVNIENGSGGIPSLFRGPVTILMGAGADTLNIGNNTAFGHAEFKALAKFDGGADADTANVSAANFANTYIVGQPVVVNFETQN